MPKTYKAHLNAIKFIHVRLLLCTLVLTDTWTKITEEVNLCFSKPILEGKANIWLNLIWTRTEIICDSKSGMSFCYFEKIMVKTKCWLPALSAFHSVF